MVWLVFTGAVRSRMHSKPLLDDRRGCTPSAQTSARCVAASRDRSLLSSGAAADGASEPLVLAPSGAVVVLPPNVYATTV